MLQAIVAASVRVAQSLKARKAFSVVAFSCSCVLVLANTGGANLALAADSAGSNSSASGSGSTRLLNGSAKDKAQIKESVRLVPPTAERHLLNGGANVKQFNGQVQSSPGSPVYPVKPPPQVFYPKYEAPRRQRMTTLFDGRAAVFQRPHIPYTPKAPPRWNYTLTPRNGIMTWSPGYQITHVAVPVTVAATNNTSASLSQRQSTAALRAKELSPGTAAWTGTGVRRLQSAPPAVAALSATPQLLTESSAVKEKKNISWEDWYKRVCNTIYKQWILDETCPGKACVRVTVWASRDIEAKVLSFEAAEGATRDAYKETGFRETSLRAINSLQKTETLDFPTSPSRDRVIFDLDMNRSVNGPSGCVVAAFHDTGDLPASVSASRSGGAGSSRDAKKR